MKLDKYIFSTFIAAAALALGSCSDFLDRSPQGQFAPCLHGQRLGL